MYTTTEMLKEMFEMGMIDQEEYKFEVTKCNLLIQESMETEKRIKERMNHLKDIKRHEKMTKTKATKIKSKFEKICELYAKGFLDEEIFQVLKEKYLPLEKHM